MRNILFIIIALVYCATAHAQIIISNDTTVCGSYSDTLQALSEELTSIQVDDTHDDVARPLGFSFDFYGISYTSCVVSANGYITFDITQAAAYSP